jgi:septum formation protein
MSVPPPRLILASSSPRRSAILAELELDFTVRPSDADESPLPGELPEDLVRRLALAKAQARAEAGELVLAADTIVVIDGQILGKPADPDDARAMLQRLSGREHEVWSGVALAQVTEAGLRVAGRVVRTEVRIRTMTAAEIAAYVADGEPMDKAGAYAIQGWGAVYVDAIRGNYTNVVGLPIPAVAACFRELGFDLVEFRIQKR